MNWVQACLDLKNSITELYRCLRSLVRIGEVIEVKGRTVRVAFPLGGHSPFIPWFSPAAGDALTWRAPSVGEQCLVINWSSGQNERQLLCLPGLFSDSFNPDKDLDPNKIYRTYKGGVKETIDFNGNYMLEAATSVIIKTPAFSLLAADSAFISAPSYQLFSATMKTEGKQSHTGDQETKGNVSIIGALDVSMMVKTLAIASYAPGAFSLGAGGAELSAAIIKTATINGVKVDTHTHKDKDGINVGPPL